jgi:hypothetical protein
MIYLWAIWSLDQLLFAGLVQRFAEIEGSALFVCLELHDTVIKLELCSLQNPFVLARRSGKCSSRRARTAAM